MPQLSGLIFDLDGTLIDSAGDLRAAMNQVLRKYGRRDLTLAEAQSFIGDGSMMLVKRAFAATGAATENLPALTQEFNITYRHIEPSREQLYPGTIEMLAGYYDKGIKLGLCTNKPEMATHALLKALDIHTLFEFVAGGDTFAHHKPNPDHVYGVITALDLPRETCVMIGDSSNDVLAAHGAGIPCIVVTHGYGADFQRLGADALIGSFEELPGALAKLGYKVV